MKFHNQTNKVTRGRVFKAGQIRWCCVDGENKFKVRMIAPYESGNLSWYCKNLDNKCPYTAIYNENLKEKVVVFFNYRYL